MLAALALVAAAATAPPLVQPDTPRQHPELPALGDKLDGWLVAAGFKGNALVSKGGKILLRKGYGMADRENNVPYAADTVFDVGSITKQFTAAMILKMEMLGRVKTDDSIARFFVDVPLDKVTITLHQLLTHTSGLESDFAGDYDPVTTEEYVRKIFKSKLRSKPGEKFYYSNAGYSLLGMIIESVTGWPYDKALRMNLFEPAGMSETGYKLPAWPASKIAVGYQDGKRWGRINEKPWDKDGPYWALRANGGVLSTLDDMLRWDKALAGDKPLNAAAKEKLYGRHIKENAGDSYYGYGWSIGTSPWGTRVIEHNGGNGVFFADFLRYPDDELVVILSTNDSEIKGGRISHGLARLAHGDDVPVPTTSAAVTLKPLETTGRDAVIRAWFDAFNATGMDAMRAFRAKYQAPRPGMTDGEREQRLTQMREELGQLTPEGITGTADGQVSVRVKSANGPRGTLAFGFNDAGKVEGVRVELGD